MATQFPFASMNDMSIPVVHVGPTGPMSKAELQAISSSALEIQQTSAITSAVNEINGSVLAAATRGMNTYSHNIRNHPYKNCIFTDAMISRICDGVREVYHDSTVTSTNSLIPNNSGLSNYVITVSWT
jgi:hypothetical protein